MSVDIPWSLKQLVDELDPTDVWLRRTPSRSVKSQEGPPLSVSASFEAEYGMHTGVRTGLVLSINADTTKFDMAAGMGIKVNYDPDPVNTVVTRVPFSETLAIVDPFVASDLFTRVFLEPDGAGGAILILRAEPPPNSLDDLRNRIYVGQLRHTGGEITLIDNNSIFAHGSSSSHIAELVLSGGITLSGGQISPSGANLEMNLGSGIYEQFGRGTNKNNPNEVEFAGYTPIPVGKFVKSYVDAFGDIVSSFSNNLLDPALFNDGGLGTLVNVSPANNFTKQRGFFAAGNDVQIIYYGTEKFSSSADTFAAVEPTFVEHENTKEISPNFELAIQGNVIDFTAAIIAGTAVIKFVLRRV